MDSIAKVHLQMTVLLCLRSASGVTAKCGASKGILTIRSPEKVP